jgi:Membrane bound O-acyl transferase family
VNAEITDNIETYRRESAEILSRLFPLVALLTLAVHFGGTLSSYGYTCCIVGAIFAGFKWGTWFPLRQVHNPKRHIAYLLSTTDMDAKRFFAEAAPPHPTIGQWLIAIGKIVLGSALIWITPLFTHSTWLQIVGLMLILHFGLLEVIALINQYFGIPAIPLMRTPIAAKSLGDFWGRRWNTAFNRIAYEHCFKPLLPFLGPIGATFAVFVASGLVHELVISVPAQGGYGLPTLYFLIQFAGMMLERTKPLRRRMRHPILRRLFMVGFVLIPLPLLAHAWFVHHVAVPMFAWLTGGIS